MDAIDLNHEPPGDDDWGLWLNQEGLKRSLSGVVAVPIPDCQLRELLPGDKPVGTEERLTRDSSLYPVPVRLTIYATGEIVADRQADWLRLDGIEWEAQPTYTGLSGAQ